MCLLLALFIGASIAENERESTLIKALKRQRITNTDIYVIGDWEKAEIAFGNGIVLMIPRGCSVTVCSFGHYHFIVSG